MAFVNMSGGAHATPAANTPANHGSPLTLLTSLFFIWGLITSLNDILIPHLKAVFTLSYVQAMLIQFSFFAAYFVMSVPSGRLVECVGYKRGIIVGLSAAATGCLLFYPAAGMRSYPLFLIALFVLASGITLLQVAANPYVTILGRPEAASRRLNLTQAFNSLGTTVGPLLGSVLILSVGAGVHAAAEAGAVQGPYLGLAAVLFALALVIARVRLPEPAAAETPADAGETAHASVWSHRHLVLGALGIFVYVGAEVAIGSFLVNLMGQPDIAGLSEHEAGRLLALYWGGAMLGRFVGVALMRRFRPSHLLAFNALVNATLLVAAMATAGQAAMWMLLAIGLFNSVMFPTIFSLALEGLGRYTGKGSGLLCMAIVGGAVVPLLQGVLADHVGILLSFAMPALCYLYIAWYGLVGHRAGARAGLEHTALRGEAA